MKMQGPDEFKRPMGLSKREPLLVNDAQYRLMLLATLDVTGALDPAQDYTIEHLEDLVVSSGLKMPLVRRVSSESPTE